MKFISILISALLLGSYGFSAPLLNYRTMVDISQYKGSTYFSVMRSVIKPALDAYANEGFQVVDGRAAISSLKKVDTKVSSGAIRSAGGSSNLKRIADRLSQQNNISFYDLPSEIGKAGGASDRYGLSTFLALISGGGVAVKINEQNYAYNVNYGTGENDKDEMTGRSFGEAPGRKALDASDKHYLQILENYVRNDGANVPNFYRGLLDILINSDPSVYRNISPEGQAVATDFLAVYTAEQDRHLMANLRSHHWDAALLEVTLLSAFHSGQKNIMVMYNGELTATTKQQAPGCSTGERKSKRASMVDYWQFSKSTDPNNCNRSGINVTRRDFRNLGRAISAYQRRNNPELVRRVERHFKNIRTGGNLFYELSQFLINYRTPARLDGETLELSKDFTDFLLQARRDANKTSSFITEQWTEDSEDAGDDGDDGDQN